VLKFRANSGVLTKNIQTKYPIAKHLYLCGLFSTSETGLRNWPPKSDIRHPKLQNICTFAAFLTHTKSASEIQNPKSEIALTRHIEKYA